MYIFTGIYSVLLFAIGFYTACMTIKNEGSTIDLIASFVILCYSGLMFLSTCQMSMFEDLMKKIDKPKIIKNNIRK